MFIRWKSIEERLPLLFSFVFREELLLDCLFLLRKEKFSSFVFGPGSVMAVRAKGERALLRLDVVVDLCFPPLCPGVAPRAK